MDYEWTHSFCLACDKQVHSTKDAYCSEACRLADFEKTSTPSSAASSPGLNSPTYPWTTKASNSTPSFQPTFNSYQTSYNTTSSEQPSARVLTPSSSHSSLCSIQSTSTTGDSTQLSAKTRQELRAYAVSFENVRMQRRRSY